MGVIDQLRVAQAFDGAEGYAGHAHVQRRIAADLAVKIAALDLPETPRILEIGCGTGFLTQELLARGVDGEWLITDKAPAMVARCREAMGAAPERRFALLDGEYGLGALDQKFDLICASMAMQWFDDLPNTVSKLLQLLEPGGRLVFNTLAADTFSEWHEAHRSIGRESGALRFPELEEIKAQLNFRSTVSLNSQAYKERFSDARAFLKGLKAIGAATSRAGHAPLPPGDLRRVMQAFEAGGASVTYEVLTCHFRRDLA